MTTVKDALAEARDSGRRVFYRPELGNAGDALINLGFYHLADDLGLRYTEITGGRTDLPFLEAGDLIVLAGGGSICSVWDIGARTLRALTRTPADLLLLPQTVEGQADALALLRPQDRLFLRERVSAEYAQSLNLACPTSLDDDMAFHIDLSRVRTRAWVRAPHDRDDLRRAAAFARHRARGAAGLPLEAWRTDDERSAVARVRRRRDDLSLLADRGTLDRASNERSAELLLRTVSWYRRIRTDRLHIGIAGALMGKDVTLSLGSYHKIRSVYEYSMAHDPRFRTVGFADDREPAPVSSRRAVAEASA